MSGEDIRWKQRFENYIKAMRLLRECAPANPKNLSDKDRLALVQAFEITLELGWKVMKDYLQDSGARVSSIPVQVVREAFNAQIIPDGQVWMDAIEARNLTSHTYNEKTAKKLTGDILSKFLPAFEKLEEKFTAYLKEEEEGNA